MASLVSSSAVCVPFGTQIDWGHFGSFIGIGRAFSCLVLDAVSFGDLPLDFIASVPMPQVTMLDLRFQGIKQMAFGARRLNFPRLTTLIFRCAGKTDLACILLCSVFLVQVKEFHLVTDRHCRVTHQFRHLFEFLHRVQLLDLRRASAAAFDTLVSTTSTAAMRHGYYCRSCPELARLRLRNVTLPAVKHLVEVRRELVYLELKELTVDIPDYMASTNVKDWLCTQTFEFKLCII
jgi:hypothetical protein